MSKRIDYMETNMTKRIDYMETNIAKKIDNLGTILTKRIDYMETNIAKKIDNLGTRILFFYESRAPLNVPSINFPTYFNQTTFNGSNSQK
ncbi:hypothetical protein BpHYR1_008496 [Brachionus plicatilis]|uniref:Uncharacterized protein n=1 Tax=Brachionus plicatilis TaxID=10195 RepID=A0A3M7T4I5_BRAPC|nr:hypothetical protein BpHYR1_008496 [Brachionus plicatilis]